MRELMLRSTPRRLTVLAFREIPDRATLRAQLDRIQRNSVPVSLAQVESALNGGPALPPRSVLLTFESGHRSVVTQALPVLTERRLPAVAFVVAELVDTEQPYWWDEAEALVRAGGWARCMPRAWTCAPRCRPCPTRTAAAAWPNSV
ncbi:polysaccharide deacetylase family protein [Streptacidiphilus monticola]